MGDLQHSIILDLAGNLQRRASQYERSMTRLGKTGSRSMRLLNRSTALASRGIDRLGNRYVALATGAAGLGTGRMLINEQRRFTRLGIQANIGADKVARLKKEIYETARAPQIRVDAGEILGAIEEIVEKTGDLKFAQENLRNIGTLISATGASGRASGGLLAELQKTGTKDPQKVLEIIDTLNVQGKEGAFTLANLAALGPRVVTAYSAMGRSGPQAFREMGAALQVIRQGTGSSEMAATAFEALLRTLGDAKKVGMLQKRGIQVFDVEALKEGRQILRPINRLMVDIIKKSGGKKTILSQVFDAEAVRAFNAASGEYQRTGNVASLEKFMRVSGDGTTTMRDAARAANDAAGGISAVGTSLHIFADKQLSGPLQQMTDALNGLESGTVDRWLKIGGGLAVGFGGLIAANKVLQSGSGIYRLLRGGRGGKGGLPGMGGGTPLPVYVVNDSFGGPNSKYRHGGRGPGSSIATSGAGSVAAAARPSLLAVGGVSMLPVAAATVVAVASRKLGKQMARNEASAASTSRLQQLRAQHMVTGGGAQSFQVKTIDAELRRRFDEGLKGELKISINSEGRPAVKALKSSRNLDIEVDAGQMMRSH